MNGTQKVQITAIVTSFIFNGQQSWIFFIILKIKNLIKYIFSFLFLNGVLGFWGTLGTLGNVQKYVKVEKIWETPRIKKRRLRAFAYAS